MSRFYDDAILGINGVVYARRSAYKTLTRSLGLPDDNYQPIYEILGEAVPPLRELIWINPATYIGITIDGDLFSFVNGKTVHLESPIVSAYLGSHNHQLNGLLVVLLENGRPRIVAINEVDSLISVNPSDIDREIPQDIMIMSPIHSRLIPDSNEEYDINDSDHFLMVTSNNEFLATTVAYHPELNQRGYPVTSNNPFDAYLRITRTIDNNLNLDYRDIVQIRSGWILMNDSKIYTIGYSGGYYLKEYIHNVKDVIDLQPRLSIYPRLLTRSGQLYANNMPVPGFEFTNPVKLVYHYYLDQHGNITTDNAIGVTVQGADGGVYRIVLGNMTELLPPNNMLSYIGRMTKSSRSVAHSLNIKSKYK